MTISEQQIDSLIENVPKYLTEKNVFELSKKSEWDFQSCSWFVWNFKYGIQNSLKGFASVKFNKVYLPDLSIFGVTSLAPIGSRKQKKNHEKITQEMGKYNLDLQYKDVATTYIDYLTISSVRYLAQGNNELLLNLIDSNNFLKTLESWTYTLFRQGGDRKEEEGEKVWDPYELQNFLEKHISDRNHRIEEENKNSNKKEPKLIFPYGFDILKDKSKISPL
jgi:hypothetical protein